MTHRYFAIGLLALLLLVAGCAEEIKAPVDPVVGHKGTLAAVPDAFATALTGADANYYVYLPDGYTATGEPYPVIYLLHGYGGDENYFPNIFSLTAVIDEQIALGEMDPMVLVFPNGDNAFGGAFYTDGLHPTVNMSETHILNVVAEVEANYNVATDAAGKGLAGASMGGYGALNIALDNPGLFGFIGAHAAPCAFWGTKTLDPLDDTYAGIEELLPAVLAQTGFTPDENWDPTNPDPDVMADFQASFDPALGPPTSMLFAMAAAFSPALAAGPTTHATTGVNLPIGLDGKLYMPVWQQWLARDILYRTVVQDATNQAAAFATFDLYMTVGLEDDLGLYGGHQVLSAVLAQVGFPPEVDEYYPAANGIPAGHVELTLPQFLAMLEWFDSKF